MLRPVRTLFLSSALLAAASCTGASPLGDGGLFDCSATFGATAEGRKITAFLRATTDFSATSAQLDTDLLNYCTAMANDLAIPASELQPMGSMTATEVVCNRVAREIREGLAEVRAQSGVTVLFTVTPPVCRVQVDTYASCLAECDATITPGTANIQCTGGEIRGTCSGECTGRCAAMATATCQGACEGTCTGSCTGTCQGHCEGTCTTRASDGSCNGACMGTCQGTCSAGCTGSCTGSCVAMASGTCTGECRGMCSVAFTEPRCTGTVTPPMVDADCRASCDAHAQVTTQCEPASFSVDVTGTIPTAVQARATRVATALRNHYGEILTVAERMRRLGIAGQAVATSAQNVPNAVQTLGARATFCAGQAATVTAQYVSRLSVSVQVSVTVTGSIQ